MKQDFTIKINMEERWIPHFLGMLKAMQRLGDIGSSRWVKFKSDGDGDFRPKFEWDIDTDCVEFVERDGDETIVSYDAG